MFALCTTAGEEEEDQKENKQKNEHMAYLKLCDDKNFNRTIPSPLGSFFLNFKKQYRK